jgi:opacity protein-like surface antigen
MVKKHLLLTFITTFYVSILFAQSSLPKYEIGISAGTMIYQGDLAPSALGSLKTMKPTATIYGARIINESFSVRLNFTLGGLKGDESLYSKPSWRQKRNFTFNSPITEASALLVWNVFGNHGSENFSRFSPYVFGGAGYSFLNIHRDWSKMDRNIFGPTSHNGAGFIKDSLHILPKGVPVIPLGIGLRYALSSNIALTTELNYRYSFSDYIDGFSYAANPSSKDSYYTFIVGAVYTFGDRNFLKCPKLKR